MENTKKIIRVALLSSLILILVIAATGFFIYKNGVKANIAVDKGISYTVKEGATIDLITKDLYAQKIIKNKTAFKLYAKFNNYVPKIKTGTYELNSYMDVKTILDTIASGQSSYKVITFYPGASVYVRMNDNDSTLSHKEVLERVGFKEAEIKPAFEANLNHPFIKRVGAKNIEGMILGETYHFDKNVALKDVFSHIFDYYNKIINENDLENQFKKQGLTLYQGITLASIVEREAKTYEDRQKVAQVFYTRMKQGMALGSDVTYQYASRMKGIANDLNLDSPYNLRKNTGLTPTPISSPSLSSLKATANPANTKYLYFLAGDDGKTYFAYTNAEHEKNIVDHCKIGCSVQ